MNTLAALSHSDRDLIETLVIGVIIIAVIAALAYFGIRAAGSLVWATRVAIAIIALGALILLLTLL